MTTHELAADYYTLRAPLRRSLGYRLRLSPDEFDELYQDAWVAVLRRHAAGDPITSVRAFLLGAIVNLWKLRIRTSARRPRATLDDSQWRDVAARDTPVEQQLLLRERVDAAIVLIAGIKDPRRRHALELRLIADMSPAEIQAELGITERTYRRLITEGMQAIDAQLELQAQAA